MSRVLLLAVLAVGCTKTKDNPFGAADAAAADAAANGADAQLGDATLPSADAMQAIDAAGLASDASWPDAVVSPGADAATGAFCGGIAAFPCPKGQRCVLDGDFPDAGGHCEAVSCEPQDVASVGMCEVIIGTFWDGSRCRWISGCSCAGADCANGYASALECDVAHDGC